MAINNIDQFKNWIKIQFGGGTTNKAVVNVELSSEQLETCISDSIEYFTKYQYGEGLYHDYLVVVTSPGVSAYPISADVEDVVDFQVSNSAQGINTLFSPLNLITGGQFNINNMDIIGYQTAMLYLEEVNSIFGSKYRIDYNPNKNVLTILPTPKTAMTALLQVYRKESAILLYNNPLVKSLALAKAKRIYGNILTKHSMTIPGGGSFANYASVLVEQGKEEEEEIYKKIFDSSEPFSFTIG